MTTPSRIQRRPGTPLAATRGSAVLAAIPRSYVIAAVALGAAIALAGIVCRSVLERMLTERTGGWADVMRDTARAALVTNFEDAERFADEIALRVREGVVDPSATSSQAVLRAVVERGGFKGYLLCDPSGRVVFTDDALRSSALGLTERELPVATARSTGHARLGLPYLGSDGHAHQLVVVVVPGSEYVLGLAVDSARLTVTMQSLHPLFTGEVYALDSEGRFLSNSRFVREMRAAGLLGPDQDDATMTVTVRDPGIDLRGGARPGELRRSLPPTLAAREAIAGHTGHELAPYRDYRGVPVIGSWTWIPDRGIGVIAEFDGHEAMEPIEVITWSFGGLSALLAIASVAAVLIAAKAQRDRLRAARAEEQAEHLGAYEIERRLGGGGMGDVFLAKHSLLRRPTAVKTIRAELLDPEALERFEREVRVTATLTHPNTIAIYDYGRTDTGVFYYAMEYLEGMDLEDLVRSKGPLPDERVIHLLRQICGSLAEAHDAGLIHRDVKPANIFLCRRGGVPDVVKVLDFGLVKEVNADHAITRASVVVGTPEHMAPELFESGDRASPASDIYALGCTAYTLLTGQRVFKGTTLADLCRSHLSEIPTLPSKRLGRAVDAVLEGLVVACLAKRVEDRPASAEEVLRWLATSARADAWTRERAEAFWGDVARSDTVLA